MCVRPSSLTILPEGDEKNDDLEQPTVKRFRILENALGQQTSAIFCGQNHLMQNQLE